MYYALNGKEAMVAAEKYGMTNSWTRVDGMAFVGLKHTSSVDGNELIFMMSVGSLVIMGHPLFFFCLLSHIPRVKPVFGIIFHSIPEYKPISVIHLLPWTPNAGYNIQCTYNASPYLYSPPPFFCYFEV
jgi:hypothetical protein